MFGTGWSPAIKYGCSLMISNVSFLWYWRTDHGQSAQEYFGSFIPVEDHRMIELDEKQIQTTARLETIEEKALAYALYLAGY